MGGKKPKVKQVNFTPPPVQAPQKTEADIAFEQTLLNQINLQNQALQQQLAGLQQQQSAQQENSTTLLAALNQQLALEREKAVQDAASAAQANELLKRQQADLENQRVATAATAADETARSRGFLSTLSRRRESTSRRRYRRDSFAV